MMENPATICPFWFGTGAENTIAQAQSKRWWAKDASIDAEIKRRFLPRRVRCSEPSS